MKRLAIGSIAFFATLAIGILLVWPTLIELSERSVPPLSTPTESEFNQARAARDIDIVPELTNVRIPDDFESVDFSHFQPVFDGSASLGRCEVSSETNGPWLGLYKRGNRFSLEATKVKFGRARNDDFGTYMPMHFRESKNAIFLISHDKEIAPGPVKTLYILPVGGEVESLLGSGFRHEFNLGQQSYVLRITSGTTETGGAVEVLLLESDGKNDILYFRNQHHGNFGSVDWVGDLDNDNRLDILFSFFAQNGGGQRYILFLSSVAKTGHLVQPFASFDARFRGC